jgi:TonB family protein
MTFVGELMRNQTWIFVSLTLFAVTSWAKAPNARPDSDGAYTIGHGVSAPKLVKAAPIVYPAESHPDGAIGSCTVSVEIDADGKPMKERVIRSISPEFDAVAIQAVNQSTFEPGKYRNKAVPVWVDIWVPFWADRTPTFPTIIPWEKAYPTQGFVSLPPAIVQGLKPNESEQGKKVKYQGTVLVSTVVTEDGFPTNVHVTQPLGMGLDEKAVDAVKQYRFIPAIKEGKPISMPITIEVNFRLY